MKWIKIEDEVPEQGRKLLYFFDCTGISLGEYYGIEPDYCPETGHVFGSQLGWLTGDGIRLFTCTAVRTVSPQNHGVTKKGTYKCDDDTDALLGNTVLIRSVNVS